MTRLRHRSQSYPLSGTHLLLNRECLPTLGELLDLDHPEAAHRVAGYPVNPSLPSIQASIRGRVSPGELALVPKQQSDSLLPRAFQSCTCNSLLRTLCGILLLPQTLRKGLASFAGSPG